MCWNVKRLEAVPERWIVRRDGPIGIELTFCHARIEVPTPITFQNERHAQLVADDLNMRRRFSFTSQ